MNKRQQEIFQIIIEEIANAIVIDKYDTKDVHSSEIYKYMITEKGDEDDQPVENNLNIKRVIREFLKEKLSKK